MKFIKEFFSKLFRNRALLAEERDKNERAMIRESIRRAENDRLPQRNHPAANTNRQFGSTGVLDDYLNNYIMQSQILGSMLHDSSNDCTSSHSSSDSSSSYSCDSSSSDSSSSGGD